MIDGTGAFAVNVCYWHFADKSAAPMFVRYWRHSGH
jgi:hypothetical protein